MSSIYQIIPKKHRSGKTVFKKYNSESYRTYFQYSEKRFDGKRHTLQKYIGVLPFLSKGSKEYEQILADWNSQLNRNIYSTPKYLFDEKLIQKLLSQS